MIQNFNVRKTSLKSLKPSRSSYLQYALSAAKKKTKVCFESTSLRKGLRDSLSFFSSSLLLPEKSLQIQAHARQAETRAGPCLQARQLQTCLKAQTAVIKCLQVMGGKRSIWCGQSSQWQEFTSHNFSKQD